VRPGQLAPGFPRCRRGAALACFASAGYDASPSAGGRTLTEGGPARADACRPGGRCCVRRGDRRMSGGLGWVRLAGQVEGAGRSGEAGVLLAAGLRGRGQVPGPATISSNRSRLR
jgi:hypothetical protein